MADVASTLRLWSKTAASNSPTDSTTIGGNLANNFQQIQAVVRQYLASTGTSMASGTTVDLSIANGYYIQITGTTTITGFGTEGAGISYLLRFASALTLTHNATSLILPGGANITTAAGDTMLIISEGSGNWRCMFYTPADGTPVVDNIIQNHLTGLTLSTAGSSATMSIAAGQATDSTNTGYMTLAASISKTTSAWTVGDAAGGLDTGAIANNTWYHFYLIKRTDTNVVDVLISTSASSPTMPTNYTLKRRIGSGKTNGSAQWTQFTQDGDDFWVYSPVIDVSATNPGTSAVTATLGSVPTGVNVKAILNAMFVAGTNSDSSAIYISDLSTADLAPVNVTSAVATPGYTVRSWNSATRSNGAQVIVRTNTSAQIRYRLSSSGASDVVSLVTLGWTDTRGK